MEESPTIPPGPDDTPTPAAAWLAAYDALLAAYSATWEIHQAPGDALAVIATREVGSEVRVLAGPPAEVHRRIDQLPKLGPEPTIVRQDAGCWVSGPGAA